MEVKRGKGMSERSRKGKKNADSEDWNPVKSVDVLEGYQGVREQL